MRRRVLRSKRWTPAALFAILVAAGGLPLVAARDARGPGPGPGIEIERLQTFQPGWLMTEISGEPGGGRAAAEHVIWPIWYLHWRPVGEFAGAALSVDRARGIVESLWEDFTIDGPLEAKRVTLPSHEAFMLESTTQRGEWKHRYYVWVCPESGRLFIADGGLSLLVNAPERLIDWMGDMARTVRCHAGAKVPKFPHLRLTREVPDGEVSFDHPFTWRPLPGYRPVVRFQESDFRASKTEPVTPEKGQDVILAMDARRGLHYEWGAPPDVPVTWEYLDQRVKDYWFGKSRDMMPAGRNSRNDIWIADGIVRMGGDRPRVPPTHMQKFRAWLWRRDGMEYFAVASVGGVLYGTQRPGLEYEEWEVSFEELLEACRN